MPFQPSHDNDSPDVNGHIQWIFDPANRDLPAQLTITAISLRTVSVASGDHSVADFQMKLGYLRDTGGLDTTDYAASYEPGTDVVVYPTQKGEPWTWDNTGSGPEDYTFDAPIAPYGLATPFIYEPSQGPLVVEIWRDDLAPTLDPLYFETAPAGASNTIGIVNTIDSVNEPILGRTVAMEIQYTFEGQTQPLVVWKQSNPQAAQRGTGQYDAHCLPMPVVDEHSSVWTSPLGYPQVSGAFLNNHGLIAASFGAERWNGRFPAQGGEPDPRFGTPTVWCPGGDHASGYEAHVIRVDRYEGVIEQAPESIVMGIADNGTVLGLAYDSNADSNTPFNVMAWVPTLGDDGCPSGPWQAFDLTEIARDDLGLWDNSGLLVPTEIAPDGRVFTGYDPDVYNSGPPLRVIGFAWDEGYPVPYELDVYDLDSQRLGHDLPAGLHRIRAQQPDERRAGPRVRGWGRGRDGHAAHRDLRHPDDGVDLRRNTDPGRSRHAELLPDRGR